MSKKIVATAVLLVVLAVVGWFAYQKFPQKAVFEPKAQPKKIGIMYRRQHMDALEGFKSGLKKQGYGDAILDEVLIVASPTMDEDTKKATRKFLDEKVDLIFTTMEHDALGALNVTKEMKNETPIVFTTRFHDPEKFGLIDSFRSSRNNATGVATNLVEIVQKNLEFFKEINPKIKKIGVFSEGFMVTAIGDAYLAELKAQAPRFGYTVVEYKTKVPPPETEKAWKEIAAKIKKGDIDALFHIAGHFVNPQEKFESELAIRLGIPMAAPSEDLPNGGHFAYSDDFRDAAERAVVIADKIFKGTKPTNIPIEFVPKSFLTLNLKRAREAGIKFSDLMLDLAEVKIDE